MAKWNAANSAAAAVASVKWLGLFEQQLRPDK
jgi:hypothetical protein